MNWAPLGGSSWNETPPGPPPRFRACAHRPMLRDDLVKAERWPFEAQLIQHTLQEDALTSSRRTELGSVGRQEVGWAGSSRGRRLDKPVVTFKVPAGRALRAGKPNGPNSGAQRSSSVGRRERRAGKRQRDRRKGPGIRQHRRVRHRSVADQKLQVVNAAVRLESGQVVRLAQSIRPGHRQAKRRPTRSLSIRQRAPGRSVVRLPGPLCKLRSCPWLYGCRSISNVLPSVITGKGLSLEGP